MNTKNRLIIPLSAVLVAALVIALTYVLASRDPHAPAVLRLAGVASAGTMSSEVAPAAAGTSADSRSSASGGYQLSGELPVGRPADAPVYALEGPWSIDRLAKALDRAGLGTDHASWWWSKSSGCFLAEPAPSGPEGKPVAEPAPDTPVSSDGTATSGEKGCASSGGGSSSGGTVSSGGTTVASPDERAKAEPQPTTPAMTSSEAKAVAKPVLDAVDLDVDDAIVTVSPWGASVWINPVVHGLPTAGYTTRVEIGRDKQISYASGFLGDLSQADSYPLVTAQEAFDRLPPAMTAMMCPVGPNGQGCQAPPPPEITGAVVGLALQQTGKGEQLLVPAWLFQVKSWTEPLPQVAVDGRYLGQPEPEQTAPVGKDDGSGQTEPGNVDPVAPTDAPKG